MYPWKLVKHNTPNNTWHSSRGKILADDINLSLNIHNLSMHMLIMTKLSTSSNSVRCVKMQKYLYVCVFKLLSFHTRYPSYPNLNILILVKLFPNQFRMQIRYTCIITYIVNCNMLLLMRSSSMHHSCNLQLIIIAK